MVLNAVTFPVDSMKQTLIRSGKGCNLFCDFLDAKGFWKSILIKNPNNCEVYREYSQCFSDC